MSNSKVALVTGSGKRRVGWHVAEALAERGYALAVHYRTSMAEAAETIASLKGNGADAFGFQADLTDESAVRAMVGGVLDRFVGEVGLETEGVAPVLPQGRDGFRGLRRGGPIVDGQGVAAPGQGVGDVPADAALAAAGHQGHATSCHRRITTSPGDGSW